VREIDAGTNQILWLAGLQRRPHAYLHVNLKI
jgi:hypothetical protein